MNLLQFMQSADSDEKGAALVVEENIIGAENKRNAVDLMLRLSSSSFETELYAVAGASAPAPRGGAAGARAARRFPGGSKNQIAAALDKVLRIEDLAIPRSIEARVANPNERMD